MARVDPDDDTIRRFIVLHYCYDPSRRERRQVEVAAFDNETEFYEFSGKLHADIEERKRTGEAEDSERVSGVVKEAGDKATQAARRLEWRKFRSAQ
jgi:hypothetical protein